MKNFSTQKDRILQFIDSKGLSKNKFYKETGIANGTLDKKSGLSMDSVEKFYSRYNEINPEWLLTGEGNMLKDEDETQVYKLRTDKEVPDQSIPLYNIEAAAGLVELFQNHGKTNVIDTIKIPNLPKCDGAVFVTGDSMYPLLKSGDIVAYKEIQDFENDIFWGEMYLISVEVAGEEWISVKYLQKSEKGEQYVKLVSQNQNHQPKDVKLSKIRALALIKASIRINSMS